MSANPDHLDYLEVQQLLSFVKSHNPVIIGGQSINIYALMYEGANPDLDKLGPLTSKDVDFYENDAAAAMLAQSLEDGKIERPKPDDFTPEAAKVTGVLGEKPVQVDFMRSIKGVKAEKVPSRALRISDPFDPNTELVLMHPVDCLRSRLANINDLRRNDDNTVKQAEASVHILDLFISQELADPDGAKRVTRVAQELEHILTDMHYGKASHHEFGDRIQALDVLRKLSNEDRLDERWRTLTLAGIISRCEQKEEVEVARRNRTPGR